MEGVAYGVLVGAAAPTAEFPITAEAEAERPTRARRSSRRESQAELADPSQEDAEAEADEADETEIPVPPPSRRRAPRAPAAAPQAADVGAEPAKAGRGASRGRGRAAVSSAEGEADASRRAGDEEVEGLEASQVVEGTVEEGEAVARKRTRRGSRGGRNRKRKVPPVGGEAHAESEATIEAADGDAGAPEEPAPAVTRPVIHMPEPDLGRQDEASSNGQVEGPVPRSRTRRGSRGGRNRRRKSPADLAGVEAGAEESDRGEAVAAAVPAREAAEADAPGGDSWEYTPMSEWDAD